METTIETRTDASLVYELLLRATYATEGVIEYGTYYEPGFYFNDSNTLALHQDWTRRYSTGQDAPRCV